MSAPGPPPAAVFAGHATVRLDLGGTRVLTDPVLTRRIWQLRRVQPPPPPRLWTDVDLVVISHLHSDHLHLPSLRRIAPSVPLVVPAGAARFLRRRGVRGRELVELAPGESAEVRGVRVSATYAAHSGRRSRFDAYRATAVGHVLEGGGRRVYAAGDTDLFDAMADIGALGLDLALVPVWGWGPSLGPGHLDPERAARALALLRPAYAVPIHWGTFTPYGMRRMMRRQLTEPPREFARLAARGAPGTRVLVTEPGHVVGELPGGAEGALGGTPDGPV